MRNKNLDKLMDKTANFMETARNLSAIATLATVGTGMLMSLKRKIQNDLKRKTLVEDLIKSDPVIGAADKDKVLEYYATIFHIAPHISADKNIVRDLLRNFLTFNKVDLNSIKMLSDAEKSMSTVYKPVDTVKAFPAITKALNTNN